MGSQLKFEIIIYKTYNTIMLEGLLRMLEKNREVFSEYDLGTAVVASLVWATASEQTNMKLREFLRKGRTGMSYTNRDLARLAIIDLTKDGGFIPVRSYPYLPTFPLVYHSQLQFDNREVHAVVFNERSPHFNNSGIERGGSQITIVAVDAMAAILLAIENGKQIVARDEANTFALEFLDRRLKK